MSKPKMTVDQFFNYLSCMTHLTEVRKYIKSQNGKTCPITAVCKSKTHAHFDISDYELAAEKLGLNAKVARSIASAADTKLGYIENKNLIKYRKRLLKAVRLNEDS